jgi:hypothetical protein
MTGIRIEKGHLTGWNVSATSPLSLKRLEPGRS